MGTKLEGAALDLWKLRSKLVEHPNIQTLPPLHGFWTKFLEWGINETLLTCSFYTRPLFIIKMTEQINYGETARHLPHVSKNEYIY